ncbi:gas vesicle structural protein [Streptomyces platensis]|uniref:Gas vesicle structural protein n=2 Tax=Streptomyces platensis TaxID=58346 RepID=A0ABX3Y017_STRPT|nr:Gas vesicle structural protein [Streptomyces platensis]
MNEPVARRMGDYPSRAGPYGGQGSSANLADILERVLDKGIVIAGDIQINLLDIELLTIKLRLLVASVDKAKEMGIDWWEHDPSLSSRASDGYRSLADENKRLRAEIRAMREGDELPAAEEEDEEEYEYEDEEEGEAEAEDKPRPAARRATRGTGGARAKRPEPRPRTKKRRDTS